MVDELLYSEHTSYDMLCQIAMKFLGPKIKGWCNNSSVLRGRGYEEDLLQELCLCLIKVTVDKFFRAKDKNGDYKYRREPAVFGKWLDTVAKNKFIDFVKLIEKNDGPSTDTDDGETLKNPTNEDEYYADSTEVLKKAFEIVLASNAGIYKILTWLAQSLIVFSCDFSRIKARDAVINAFENKTLADMYSMILVAAKRIRWLEISDEQHDKIMDSLKSPWDDEKCYGEVVYREFFMRYKGEVSPKKSISDWVNRMDSEVKRNITDKGIPKTQNKKKKKNDCAKKSKDPDDTGSTIKDKNTTEGGSENESFDV